MQFVCAQEVLVLPYEANSLTEEQKAMNPDRLAYPTELKDTYYTNSNADNYSHNVYTVAQWEKMESGGAVFLPAAGLRDGTTVFDVSTIGYYWSSTHFSSNNAYDLSFYTNGLGPQYDDRRNDGFSVRLVSDVK